MALFALPWSGTIKTYALLQDYGPTSLTLEPTYGGYAHFHAGLDFALPQGTQVICPAPGTVVAAGPQPSGSRWYSWGFGDNALIIQHDNGYITVYGHLESLSVTQGQTVTLGQPLGQSGGLQPGAGNSNAWHLHFQINSAWYVPTSPWPLLGYSGVSADGSGSSLSAPLPSATPIGTLDYPTVIILARQAGVPESQLATCAAICYAESTFEVAAQNASGAAGLWQILPSAHPQYDVSRLLSDPAYNAAAMYAISNKGTNWTPWQSYTAPKGNPRYLAFMPAARQALSQTPPGTPLQLPSGQLQSVIAGPGFSIPQDFVAPQLPENKVDIQPVRLYTDNLAPLDNAESVAMLVFNAGFLPVTQMKVSRTMYNNPGTLTASTDVGFVREVENATLLDALCAQEDTQVTALMGYVPNTQQYWTADMLLPVFTGMLDAPEFTHDGPDDTLDLTATDMSILFSEPSATPQNLTQYANMTSTRVVQEIVKARNLKGSNGLTVQAATTDTMAGDVFDQNSIQTMQVGETEWQVITALAETEGWVAFWQGTTLYFGPLPQDQSPLVLPFAYHDPTRPISNVSKVQIKPQKHSKRDYKITVTSYQKATGETLSVDAGNTLSQNVMTFPQKPNTPKSVLNKKAQSLLQIYSATEVIATITIDGLIRLEQGRPIAISSDRLVPAFRWPYRKYYPVQVDYEYQQGQGFTMTITATNRPWGIQSTDTAQQTIFAGA